MKCQLALPDLSVRRRISRLCLSIKCTIRNHYDSLSSASPAISLQDSIIRARLPFPRPFQHSLLPEAIVDWNGLPDDIVTITDNAKIRTVLTMHSPL